MSSIRCSNCDLVNFANQLTCRRCQASLSAPFRAAPQDYPTMPPNAAYRAPMQAPPGYYHAARPVAPAYPPPQPQPAPYQQTAGVYAPPASPQQQYAYQGGVRGYIQTAPAQAGTHGVWRRHGQVVMLKQAELPNSCVKCGSAVMDEEKARVRLFWHHPALYIALFSPLLYAIIAAIFSKRATIYAGLCAQHKDSRRNKLLTSLSLIIGGAVGFFFFLANGPTELAFVSALMFLAGAIVLCFYQPLKATEIDDTHIWLKGADKKFIDSLPAWEERNISSYR